MTFNTRLGQTCTQKNSSLCIGLDVDLSRLPADIPATRDGVIRFCREIIDATHRYAAAYKPNSAFFESMGTWGLDALLTVRQHIPPDAITILDAKRGDLDNTNVQYARAAFDILGFDAITVHPYLGAEALDPFLCRPENGVFVLCRTSNPGAGEFQDMRIDSGEPLFLAVAKAAHTWNKNGNCGLVTGATYPNELEQVRSVAPDLPLLIPGIGAQGGDLEASVKAAGIGAPMLINASRSILYASTERDYPEAAAVAAAKLHAEIIQVRAAFTLRSH